MMYQIRERVELLSHEGRLLAPPCNLAIHEVEEQTKWHESQGRPDGAVFSRFAETVAHGGEHRHDCSKC